MRRTVHVSRESRELKSNLISSIVLFVLLSVVTSQAQLTDKLAHEVYHAFPEKGLAFPYFVDCICATQLSKPPFWKPWFPNCSMSVAEHVYETFHCGDTDVSCMTDLSKECAVVAIKQSKHLQSHIRIMQTPRPIIPVVQKMEQPVPPMIPDCVRLFASIDREWCNDWHARSVIDCAQGFGRMCWKLETGALQCACAPV
jgi:hypothetical protein